MGKIENRIGFRSETPKANSVRISCVFRTEKTIQASRSFSPKSPLLYYNYIYNYIENGCSIIMFELGTMTGFSESFRVILLYK